MSYRSKKYGNRTVRTDAGKFDSVREAHRWYELQLMENAGEITDLKRQVPFELIPNQLGEDGMVRERKLVYIADFTYTDKDGKFVVEDSKGFKTDTYRIKKKLLLFFRGLEVKEV